MRLLIFFLITPLLALAQTTRSFDIEPFTELYGSYAIQIELVQAPETTLEVTTRNAQDMDAVVVDSRDGRLIVKLRDGMQYRDIKVKMRITSPDIDKLRLAGATRTEVIGFDDLSLLEVDLAGASLLELKDGSARSLDIEAAGASNLMATDFPTETCNIRLAGASRAELNVSESISGMAAGASNLRYRGGAQEVKMMSAGASRVSSF